MSDNLRPAIYVDPKIALELHRRIKTFGGFMTEDRKQCFVDFLLGDGLTDRDLLIFVLGKMAGLEAGHECFTGKSMEVHA